MDRDFKQYHRGEIYFANLDPHYGSEQGGIRPVLIVQNDSGNRYSPTLVVAAATAAFMNFPVCSMTRSAQLIEIMQKPKNYILTIETGGSPL